MWIAGKGQQRNVDHWQRATKKCGSLAKGNKEIWIAGKGQPRNVDRWQRTTWKCVRQHLVVGVAPFGLEQQCVRGAAFDVDCHLNILIFCVDVFK